MKGIIVATVWMYTLGVFGLPILAYTTGLWFLLLVWPPVLAVYILDIVPNAIKDWNEP